MTIAPTLYYLADCNDLVRLMSDGSIQAARDGTPWYFTSEDAANAHDDAHGLTVFSVPAAETIPGAPKGTRIEDAVCAETVLARIDQKALREMALEVARLCRL